MADITITKDAELDQLRPDERLGLEPEARIALDIQNKRKNMVMGFDLSAIPLGSRINEAKLTLVNINRSDVDVVIYPLITEWDELTVSWNDPWQNQKGGDFVTNPSINTTLQGRNRATEINIIPLVEYWIKANYPQYGIVFQAINSNTEAKIYTKDAPNNQLSLIINYTPATPTDQIDAGYTQIQALPDSDFFMNRGDIAKRIFKRLSNTSKILISRGLNNQAKIILDTIIRFMDGSGFDLIINPVSRDRIRPFYEQAKANL